MEITTFEDLIEWSRELHHHLGRCMKLGAEKHRDEMAQALLEYLAKHEKKLEDMIGAFERQADAKALKIHVYDYLAEGPLKKHRTCTVPYEKLDYDGICREVFDYHDQLMDFYNRMSGKAETADAYELMKDLLEMERNESMQLAQQISQGQSL